MRKSQGSVLWYVTADDDEIDAADERLLEAVRNERFSDYKTKKKLN